MQTLCRPQILVLDEMGYFSLDKRAAQFLFQLVSRRYQRGSIILTSNEAPCSKLRGILQSNINSSAASREVFDPTRNKSYNEWGAIFPDHVLASAILDRLLHHAVTVNIRGNSYRLKDKLRASAASDASSKTKEK